MVSVCDVCCKIVSLKECFINKHDLYICNACQLIQEEDDCDWVTTSGGAKICIGSDGKISKGPSSMIGKSPDEIGGGDKKGKKINDIKISNTKEFNNNIDSAMDAASAKMEKNGTNLFYEDGEINRNGALKYKNEVKKHLGIDTSKFEQDFIGTNLVSDYGKDQELLNVKQFGEDYKNYVEGDFSKIKDETVLKEALVDKKINNKILKEKYGEKMVLFRAVRDEQSSFPENNLIGFTNSKGAAKDFLNNYKTKGFNDAKILKVEVPIDNIWFSHETDLGLKHGENEYVVMLHDKDLKNMNVLGVEK